MIDTIELAAEPGATVLRHKRDLPCDRPEPSKDRPRIVVILPRGEAIRNLVYTGALDELDQAAEITLFSVLPDEDFRTALGARFRHILELEEIGERRVVHILREMLDLAHGRWLWSEAAQERWRRRDREASAVLPWLKRSAKKLFSYPFASRRGLEILAGLAMVTSRWLRTSDKYIRLLEQLRPALVFNASHVHAACATPLVEAARWLKIPTATFIFSWDNLTSQGRVHPPYDFYLVWNSAIRDQLLEVYRSVQPEQVIVTGTPQFDFHLRPEFFWSRQQFCQRVGADPSRPIVLYSTGIADHMPAEPEVVEDIAGILSELTDLGPPQLLVRVYPKDDTSRFETLKQRRPDILFPAVPWVRAWYSPTLDDAYLLTNTLRHCALGINVASTVSLELCIFDKPVINIGYNPPGLPVDVLDYGRYYDFEHYRPVAKSGAVTVVKSREALKNAIVRMLRSPQEDSPARQQLVAQLFGTFLDGLSGRRVAEALLRLAGNGLETPREI